MTKPVYGLTLFGLLCAFTTATNAAFVVGVDLDAAVSSIPSSLHPNFSYGGDTTSSGDSIGSAAVGVASYGSLFGGDGATQPDTYQITYRPGMDVDNFSPAPGALLGSTTGYGVETATGATGGVSGNYNVYFTTPESMNVDGRSNITITGDGAPIVLSNVDLNINGTGADLDPGPAFVGGANNAWFKVGTVALTAGNSYTFTMESTANTFVSQRLAGVMWELVPEPECGLLFGLPGLALLAIVRRRK